MLMKKWKWLKQMKDLEFKNKIIRDKQLIKEEQ